MRRLSSPRGRWVAVVVAAAAACCCTTTSLAQAPTEPSWQSWGLTKGINGPATALTTWDPDGSGALPEQLVVGGAFTSAGGVTVNHIARWDGVAWQLFGGGVNGTVNALTKWDPDGEGPLPTQLVAGGLFTAAGGVTLNGIARWDGAAWHPLGTGVNGFVNSLVNWDPDGLGPSPAQLVAGGHFISAGGVEVNGVARWDGTAWQAFGCGLSDHDVFSVTTWDPDGTGPLSEQVVAGGGNFYVPGCVSMQGIARWDGAAWQQVGSIVSGAAYALLAWDPDGSGPFEASLVEGGASATGSGGIEVNSIAPGVGAAWQPLGSGMVRPPQALVNWDPDGSGPLPPEVVAGDIDSAGGVVVHGIAHWNGAVWQPFGNGVRGGVYALTTWDPDGSGLMPAQLVAGGPFSTGGNPPAQFLAT